MSSLPLNEKNYQESKQKDLQNLLGEYCSNIEWIWIGGASRRRVTFQIDGKNRLGFFAEKSHDLIEIENDPSAEKEISNLIPTLKNFLKTQEQNFYDQIVITLFDNGLDVIFVSKKDLNFSQTQKLTNFAKEQKLNISSRVKNHLMPVFLSRKNQIFFENFKIDVESDVFVQATKSGLENITKIIRDSITKPLNIIDLYAGFGAYSFAISDLAKSILAVEGDEKMVNLIKKNAAANNLGSKIQTEIRDLFNDPLNKLELKNCDLAIINPPRNGASPQIIQITKSPIKNLIYVSCYPESFKRDARILIDAGFKITKLFALDQFYGTKHLELISIFQK
jgi:23S rRNA (uracil1939-C5)-methyltransferase